MAGDAVRTFVIPRWVQLVGLPLAVIGLWQLIAAVNHAVFIFIVAALIAILLNPIVRAFMRFGLPRSLAVFIVYGLFAVAIASTAVIVATVVADQVSSVSSIVEEEFNTPAGGGAHRPSAGLARLPRPGAGQGARPGEPGDRPDPLDRSPGVHRQGGRHR